MSFVPEYSLKRKRSVHVLLFSIFAIMVSVFSCLLWDLVFPATVYAEDWLKVEKSEGDLVWIDTSHWDTVSVLVNDGYYRDVIKKRWIDNSYTVVQGYWETGQYRVWVESSIIVPYTAYRYVDTSHWETTYRYVDVIRPVNFSVIFGTDSYGWSVYSFASQSRGATEVTYNGERYIANVYVIDYRPYRGGRIYAVKYVFIYKFVKEKQYYNQWVSSGYWQPYTAYRLLDTSHWETRTGRYWVDTSSRVESGYWEEYVEKEWVSTQHYENRRVWVSEGHYTSQIHGKITVEKKPGYIFTRWHKNGDGSDCRMDLKVSWQIDNSMIQPGENPKKITGAHIYQETKRYNGRGLEKTEIYGGQVAPSEAGSIGISALFDFAGDIDSILHIFLYSAEGNLIHVYFSNPVNGFRSINIDQEGTGKDADRWLGGNTCGEITF